MMIMRAIDMVFLLNEQSRMSNEVVIHFHLRIIEFHNGGMRQISIFDRFQRQYERDEGGLDHCNHF